MPHGPPLRPYLQRPRHGWGGVGWIPYGDIPILGIGYYKPDPWDSHSKQVSRQPQKASMLNQLTDLLLECSDCESLHNGPGWLRFALNKCAKCNLGPSLGVRLKTSLDPANAGSRQTSRPAGKQTSRQASQYIYIYTPVLCCTVLCCAVHMGRNEEQDLPSFGLLFRWQWLILLHHLFPARWRAWTDTWSVDRRSWSRRWRGRACPWSCATCQSHTGYTFPPRLPNSSPLTVPSSSVSPLRCRSSEWTVQGCLQRVSLPRMSQQPDKAPTI